MDLAPTTTPNLVYEIPYKSVVEDRPNTVSHLYKNTDFFNESSYTQPSQNLKKIIILIDGKPLLISEESSKNSTFNTTAIQNGSFKEQLDEIKTGLTLSITQLAELFGVTRKTVYDWYEGTTPRHGITSRMNILVDVLKSMPSEVDLPRLKTVWNIPVSGKSFRSIFNDEILDELSFRTTIDKKLYELSPRLAKKTGSQRKTSVQLGKAHLAEFDKYTDAI